MRLLLGSPQEVAVNNGGCECQDLAIALIDSVLTLLSSRSVTVDDAVEGKVELVIFFLAVLSGKQTFYFPKNVNHFGV